MKLLDTLEKEQKKLEKKDTNKHIIFINLVKRLYCDLDIYSESLIYIWQDNNRFKINMDGEKSIFHIKKGTKFSRIPTELNADVFTKHIEKQVKDFLALRGIEIYGFYFNERILIFKIKSFKEVDLQKCLY